MQCVLGMLEKRTKELVEKLRRKLEGGSGGSRSSEKSVILLKRDRSGNVVPARSNKSSSERFAETSSRIQREYGKEQNFRDMVQEEKSSTAEDQLMLFHKSIIVGLFFTCFLFLSAKIVTLRHLVPSGFNFFPYVRLIQVGKF
ncbi:unnamed protein product [Cylicostephanus goldi]|uniref:Uncharacterized protein n=1 Tax=Cylicostephanus goldi TaxID=71465 RepID=A0A3P6RMF2_CYLGO|nr:unnamed protein product [Cylicostephanus goldi]